MSSNKVHKLSGEEALNEYFTALLDEELDLSFDSEPSPEPVLVEEASAVVTPAAELQPKNETSTVAGGLSFSEYDVPDLEDVQKLLDKLEATDLASEPEVVTLLEQNNATLSKTEWVEPETTLVVESEEIQEWDTETITEIEQEVVVEDSVEVESDLETATEQEVSAQASAFKDWTSTKRDEDFQVLYFDVNGVTFAVPLDELGGIHRVEEMSHLIGRPDWYLGLQTTKDTQYDVVDTAKWVMADRLKDEEYKECYQYIVMLGTSQWGLAATELKGTEALNVESVRWREQAGKRPWLAGMVKEKMCALIHVEAMIKMITAGLDVKSLDS